MPIYGAVEAGGTKFVCLIAEGPHKVYARVRFPTTQPEETLGRAVAFFQEAGIPLAAVGIGCFGPVDLHPSSPTYGHITSTPKPGWQNVNVVGYFQEALGVPVAFDTDVNAAALGEHLWGATQDVHTFIYITVGTGIGGGVMVNGRLVHGLMHPEMGHMRIPHPWDEDPFPGICPYHGDCLEGLAAGPAIAARWQQDPATLPAAHPAWDLEARYLGWAIANLVCTLSPERIVLGGGVMHQEHLFPKIRRVVQEVLAGYIQHPVLLTEMDRYIVPPGLGDNAGIFGALALAVQMTSASG